ncbi:MAG: 50S ribosomal protein L6, partial [Candidatus Binatia bacterium]
MAGVGRWPVPIPDKVKVSMSGGTVAVQGPKGKLEYAVDPAVSVQVTDGKVTVTRQEESRQAKALHG